MYKVCIADDEELVLESIRQRIAKSGMNLEVTGVARNGIEAYELYEKVSPDIYFVDINMPLCSGLDFVERVRRLDKDSITKFVIISGYDDFKYVKKAIQTRVVNYILKPIQQQEFLDTLREVCESLDEIKQRMHEEYKRQWQYFRNFLQSMPVFSGTALLLYGDRLMERIQSGETEETQSLSAVFPPETWSYIRFHECDNLSLMLAENKWLDERQINEIWEKIKCTGEDYLVYKTGKGMNTAGMMKEMESVLNGRFWAGSLHLLASVKPEQNEYEGGLEELNKALEDFREEKWREKLELVFQKVFENRKNRGILTEFYHYVLILAADKYRQHNFDIPENLKRELYPYSIDNCASQDEIRDKISEYLKLIHEKIVRGSGRNDLSDQAATYLEMHYTEDITLTDLANEFFVAPVYLAKRFKEKQNITVMQFLENCRMEKAVELLESSELNVTEIARLTGYNDANYFTRAFKKKHGMTPREYRSREG